MIGTNRNPRTALTTATSTRSESLTGKRYFAPVGTAELVSGNLRAWSGCAHVENVQRAASGVPSMQCLPIRENARRTVHCEACASCSPPSDIIELRRRKSPSRTRLPVITPS